jgi:hypothetical protein
MDNNKNTKVNLNSSTLVIGETVTQIIHFKGGIKRTFTGVNTNSIKQGQFTKFILENGSMILIHDINVLMIEVIPEK